MVCTEWGQHDPADKPHYCVNCGAYLGPRTEIHYGKNRIEIVDETGAVTVEHFKSRDERNTILARFGLDGNDCEAYEVNIVSIPFRRWVRKIFGKS
jgi:hypothetical protein